MYHNLQGGKIMKALIPIQNQNTQVQKGNLNISDLVSFFLNDMDVRESSKALYKRTLKQFMDWLNTNKIKSPIRQDILDYKRFLVKYKYSPGTVASYLIIVKKFFAWVEQTNLYPNIAAGIKGPKQSRTFKKDPLGPDQIKKLLDVDCSTLEGKRNFAILNLLVRTGLRTIEAIRPNIEDIRQESGKPVLWIQGKGRDEKDAFVLLTESTYTPIMQYLNERKNIKANDPLFCSCSRRNKGGRLTTRTISSIVKTRLRKIGLNSSRLSAHSLRHTAITISLLAGASLQEAQALGRHGNINTTLIYSHNLDRVKNAAENKIEAYLSKSVV